MKPAGGLGEFGRIREFFAPLAGLGALDLTDDAALVDCPPGYRLVVTVDQLVEGVHFLADDPPELVAKKLLRRNLSDLAAMGATPRHYLVTSALPVSCGDDWVRRFAEGLAEDQHHFDIALLGGDSTSTPGPMSLTLTAIGQVAAGREIRRSGAKPGDRVWVSGTIGDAFLGLKVLRGEYRELAPEHRAALVARFRLPDPRTELGPRLAGIAHAMIDVSDGLLADLGHICETSGVAATVALPRVPLSPAARAVVANDATLPAVLATAGDDYELLFTAPPDADDEIVSLSRGLDLPITEIGAVEAGAGVRLVDAGGRARSRSRPRAGGTSDGCSELAQNCPAARRLPGAGDDQHEHPGDDRGDHRQHAGDQQGAVDPAGGVAADRDDVRDDPGGAVDGADRPARRVLDGHLDRRDRRGRCRHRGVGRLVPTLLPRHIYDRRLERVRPAIPLRRGRALRRELPRAGDLAGSGGRGGLGRVRAGDREMVARPVRAGVVCRLLRDDRGVADRRGGAVVVCPSAAAPAARDATWRRAAARRDRPAAAFYRRAARRDDWLRGDGAGDDRDADRDDRLWVPVHRCRVRHPVAHPRHVRAELCDRQPDQPIRPVDDPAGWRGAAARLLRDQPRRHRRGQFLGGQRAARGWLEFPLHRRDDLADPHLPAGGARQGPGAQRFHDFRHLDRGVLFVGRAVGGVGLDGGAADGDAVCRGRRRGGHLDAAARSPAPSNTPALCRAMQRMVRLPEGWSSGMVAQPDLPTAAAARR